MIDEETFARLEIVAAVRRCHAEGCPVAGDADAIAEIGFVG